jgi:hypothetical protein
MTPERLNPLWKPQCILSTQKAVCFRGTTEVMCFDQFKCPVSFPNLSTGFLGKHGLGIPGKTGEIPSERNMYDIIAAAIIMYEVAFGRGWLKNLGIMGCGRLGI